MAEYAELNGERVMLREYNFDTDPPKLVKYLFDKMDSPQGIEELRKGDQWFHDENTLRMRLVAEIQGELVATATVARDLSNRTQHNFHLYSVVTAPHFQGSGLSALLFDNLIQWVKAHGGSILLVSTWGSNHQARRYYEKLGFIHFGTVPKGVEGENGLEDHIYYYMPLTAR